MATDVGTTSSEPRLRRDNLSSANCIALSVALMAPVLAVILSAPAVGPSAESALVLAFLPSSGSFASFGSVLAEEGPLSELSRATSWTPPLS